VISGKTASPSISQTLRHYWVSAICDAVVLVLLRQKVASSGVTV
jgi:hypothetical protein